MYNSISIIINNIKYNFVELCITLLKKPNFYRVISAMIQTTLIRWSDVSYGVRKSNTDRNKEQRVYNYYHYNNIN